MVPQIHPLGDEAEVDFGQVTFVLAGVMTELWIFVMRLSASGRAFHRVYANQAQEVFLDGHVARLRPFRCACPPLRYDNLKPAVIKVLMGRDRSRPTASSALRSHYMFDSFFCLPGVEGAHEKGGVEGEVGRFRRRHLVPVPKVSSLAELNELVADGRRARRPSPRRRAQAHRGRSTSPSSGRMLRAVERGLRRRPRAQPAGRPEGEDLRAPVLLLGPCPPRRPRVPVRPRRRECRGERQGPPRRQSSSRRGQGESSPSSSTTTSRCCR